MLHNLFFMEQHFLLWLQDSVRNPMLTKIFVFITSLGNGGAFWILLSLGLMIPKKTRKAGTLSLLSLACCAIVTNVCLKNLVARTRPYDVIEGLTSLVGIQKDFSFPSGHTAASFASVVSDITEKIWHTASYSGIPHRIFQNVCGSPLPVRRAWRAVSRQSDRSCGVLGRNKESKGLGK